MPSINPNYVEPQSKPQRKSTGFNESVPPGHRSKCRECGCVDNVCISGKDRRLRRCGACGGKVALRRAPREPKIVSFIVVRQLNGESYGDVPCVDRFVAERTAITFCERGPVARSRVAAVVELLDNNHTGNVRVLKYDNFRQRRSSIVWSSGCETCKGRGLIAVRMAPRSIYIDDPNGKHRNTPDKATLKYVACESCNGLGGELTKRVMWGRAIK